MEIKNPRLMICGEGRHGKDTVALLLFKTLGLTFITSSEVGNEKVVFPALKNKYGYKTLEECFEDRFKHRDEWFDLITEYNTPNKTRLALDLFTQYNQYVGCRNKDEFLAIKDSPLKPHLTIWVDASIRKGTKEGKSNQITAQMCDITIDNNGTKEELLEKVERLSISLSTLFDKRDTLFL